MSCGTRTARLLDRAFVDGLSPRRWRALRRHLAGCADCRARYDRLAAVDARLGGAMTAAMLDAIGTEVVAGATPRRRAAMWGGVAVAVTAVAAAALLYVRRPDAPDELRPRGGGGIAGERAPGVRLFCVVGDQVIDESRAVADGAPVPALRCTIDAELQLAYSTPDLEGLTMVAFGRTESSTLLYAPRPGTSAALPLAANAVDEALAWSTRLGVHHRPGTYEIVVRFFDRPVDVAQAIDGAVAPVSELRGRLELVPAGGALDGR